METAPTKLSKVESLSEVFIALALKMSFQNESNKNPLKMPWVFVAKQVTRTSL